MKTYPTTIGGLELPHFFMNASGPICTTLDELEQLKAAKCIGAVVTKSATLLPRNGNPEPRWCPLKTGGGIQSMGLPNLGYDQYIKFIKVLKEDDNCPPVIMSVSGLSIEDNVKILTEILSGAKENHSTDAIELNLSCPNIPGKPQVGYDFVQTEVVLSQISRIKGIQKKTFGLKLPPYFDDSHFDSITQIINRFNTEQPGFVNFITCINAVGNCLVLDLETETPLIKPKYGHGGLCGRMVKPIGLSNVANFRRRLPAEVDIIGVGGVENGIDAYEYFLVGADAVQVGSQAMIEGPHVFERLSREFHEHLVSRDIEDISVKDIRKRMNYL